MLTISKMFTFLFNLPVWEIGNIPVVFKASKLFIQMNAQLFLLPGKTEGRGKAFLKWKGKNLSYELSLTLEDNVNYYKSVHHPISRFLLVRIGSILANFKINQ